MLNTGFVVILFAHLFSALLSLICAPRGGPLLTATSGALPSSFLLGSAYGKRWQGRETLEERGWWVLYSYSVSGGPSLLVRALTGSSSTASSS